MGEDRAGLCRVLKNLTGLCLFPGRAALNPCNFLSCGSVFAILELQGSHLLLSCNDSGWQLVTRKTTTRIELRL